MTGTTFTSPLRTVDVDGNEIWRDTDAAAGPTFINVKSAFGAVGNGVTIDTTAFAEAFAAASAAGGGVVFVPTGTYVLTSARRLPPKTTLAGEGQESSILYFDHTDNGIIVSGDVNRICDLGLQMRTTGSVEAAVKGWAAGHRLEIERCLFWGGGPNNYAVEIDAWNDFRMSDCYGGYSGKNLTALGFFRAFNSNPAVESYNFGDYWFHGNRVTIRRENGKGFYIEGPDATPGANRKGGDIRFYGGWTIAVASASATSINPTGSMGIHIRNSFNVHTYGMNLEGGLNYGVFSETQAASGASTEFNSFFGVSFLTGVTPYAVSGAPTRALFMGGKAFPGAGYGGGAYADGDIITPLGIMFTTSAGSVVSRLWDNGGTLLQMNTSVANSGLQFGINSALSPDIRPVSTTSTTFMVLGRSGTRGIAARPCVVFETQTSAVPSPVDGMVAFADGVSWNPGQGRGLYVFTSASSWSRIPT